MARYIDADALIKKNFPLGIGDGKYILNAKAVKLAIDNAPTAEVVPKSEVEALQEALSKAEADGKNYMKVAEYQQSLSVKRYHEIKQLNEEIETLKDNNEHLAVMLEEAKQAYANYEETTGLKQAKADVAWAIFDNVDEIAYRYLNDADYSAGDMIYDLNELKKKYTEEKT